MINIVDDLVIRDIIEQMFDFIERSRLHTEGTERHGDGTRGRRELAGVEDNEEMGILERLVVRDTLCEALALLTPVEVLMAVGRANGMSDEEVADALGIEPVSVSCRLTLARERIADEIRPK